MEPAGKNKLTVLAAAAHPDDIEFMMAGTLLLLKERGADIHMWNIASGSGGSLIHDAKEISRIRWEEARASARLIGATLHPPIADDLEVFYTKPLIAKAIAVVRKVKPSIILVPSPMDYMEDHQNACRLAVTGAFGRGIKNVESDPPVDAWMGETVLYHAMPDRLRDMLRRRVKAGMYVDITSVMDKKEEMLLCHESQKGWLDDSQGIDSFSGLMQSMARELGELSGRFTMAEGWRRHEYQGYGAPDFDPLSDVLGDLCWIDPAYEATLEEGI
jgi:LmbE family N-acetylglucosaminyl deacetylase